MPTSILEADNPNLKSGGIPGRMSRFIRGLHRETVSTSFLPEIDGLRGIAILGVILHHIANNVMVNPTVPMEKPSGTTLGWLLGYGHLGVQLFFTISGFILALPFAAYFLNGAKKPSLRTYARRRAYRLAPPYLLSLLAFFVLTAWGTAATLGQLAPHLFSMLFYSHWLVYHTHNPVNVVAWSLEVEVQFCIAVPMLVQLFRIKCASVRRLTIIAVCVSAAFLQSVVVPRHPVLEGWVGFSLAGYIQFFLAGFLAVDFYLDPRFRDSARGSKWDVLSVLGLGMFFMFGNVGWFNDLALCYLFGLACLAPMKGIVASWVLSRPVLTVIGGMCYSLYLTHNKLLAFLGVYVKRQFPIHSYALDYLVHALVLLPFILFTGLIFFVLVEKPCMSKTPPRWLLLGAGNKT